MKDRLIDIALLTTLVVVGFAIMWTLFTLGGDSSANRTEQPDERPPTLSQDSDIVPIAPEELAPTTPAPSIPLVSDTLSGTPTPVSPEEPPPEPEPPASRPEPETIAVTPEPPVAEAPTPSPVVRAEGAVVLQRIGFSFVTGGAGACGVTLEAWKHIAVSRELLAEYGCGAELTLTLDEEIAGRTSFQAVIGDTMNPTHSSTANIYVGQEEPALEYGVTTGALGSP
ncbi:MAG: hypothetical protein JSV66_14685 [Trueperaceae bacterium]|nr:MAG: hypothetical protein JSV66_14685 [Trueperaceae bacterium]